MQNTKHSVFVVSHKEKKGDQYIPNVGLEFGCYSWYLNNKWESGDTLFIHDDIEITEAALDEIAKIPFDQCFLFASKEECDANGKAHGRAFFCSDRFLKKLKEDGGFWYDEGNHGDIPATTSDSPNYHNSGIITFRAYLKSLGDKFTVEQVGVVPGLKCGYRGRL